MPCVKVVVLGRKRERIKRVLLLDCPECNYSKGLKSEEDWASVGVERMRREGMLLGVYQVGHPDEGPLA